MRWLAILQCLECCEVVVHGRAYDACIFGCIFVVYSRLTHRSIVLLRMLRVYDLYTNAYCISWRIRTYYERYDRWKRCFEGFHECNGCNGKIRMF